MTRDQIGRICVIERNQGTSWKILMDRFNLGRTRLYQIHKQAREKMQKVNIFSVDTESKMFMNTLPLDF